jgi:hypothetical protein
MGQTQLSQQPAQTKVFGIGLNKTGTTTLAHCFRIFGYKHLTTRRDLLVAYREGRLREIYSVIDKFQSFEDWPYPLMYRELFYQYPNAKFVLTKRKDAETWLRSLRKHSLITSPTGHCRRLAYGYNYPFYYSKAHIELYQKHNADVVSFFTEQGARDRLLIINWEEGDGWETLSAFLGVETPKKKVSQKEPRKAPIVEEPPTIKQSLARRFLGKTLNINYY